jgi:hypothetical protein
MSRVITGKRVIMDHVMAFDLSHCAVNMFRLNNDYWAVVRIDKERPERSKGLVCISFEHASAIFDMCIDKLFLPLV